ncbi:MAG: PocR ligand-binding domain-containing protein [bacterium]
MKTPAHSEPLQTPDISFEKLFNIPDVQRLQDEFAEATGVASIITRPDGVPITEPSNFTCLCSQVIRKTEKGCANCYASDASIGRFHPDGPIIQPCLSGGLWDAGASVNVAGHHIANWLIGQVRDSTQTEEKMRSYAREIGADEAVFMDAFQRVPTMPFSRFEKVAKTLFTLANQLSTLAFQNLQQNQTIASLRQAERSLRLKNDVFDASMAANSVADPNGNITEANPMFLKLWGYQSKAQVIGLPIRNFIQDPAEAGTIVAALNTTGQWEGIYTARRQDGSTFIARGIATILRDQNGITIGYQSSVTDITQRLRDEAARHLVEAQMEQAFGASPIGMALVGLDGQFMRVNQRFCAMVGWSEADLQARGFQAITHPDDLAEDLAYVQALIEGRQDAYQMDKRYIHKDGHGVWAQLNVSLVKDTHGKPMHFVSQVQDITRRKQAEAYRAMGVEILHILNEPGDPSDFFPRILAVFKEGTGLDAIGIRMHVGDDFPYLVQEGFSSDFLLTENSLVERDTQGNLCLDENDKPHLECTCGLILSGKTDPANPLFTPGGSAWTNNSFLLLDVPAEQDPRHHPRNRCIHQGYASLALVPIRDQVNIIGLIQFNDRHKDCFTTETIEILEGIATHIGIALTRKRVEAELQKMRNLQSLGTLAGGIAHDFNNIMMGLFGNIALAKNELPGNHPSHGLLEKAGQSMGRAIHLTHQLLTFAKGGAPIIETLNLADLVAEVARFDLSGSNVLLEFTPEADLWLAQADKGQIQQVVSNLTTNARQAMPNGGHLYIHLENSRIDRDDFHGLLPGKYLKLTMKDEGIGIDPKIIGRIFEPYFTTKTSSNGLGLATTYSIIQKHGGYIDVVSIQGAGTIFTVYLPAAESPPPAEKSPPSVMPLSRSLRILVMDDEEFIRIIIPHWLTPSGCMVETAEDGRQAIGQFKQALSAGTPFDLVILDLTIPGSMGGTEVMKQFLSCQPKVRGIVSSGYAEDPVMSNYAEYGFKGILAKPYTESQLKEVVDRVMSGS